MNTPTEQTKTEGLADVASSDLLAAWMEQLKAHAESKGYGWLIDPQGDYDEYFKDGCTPEECFDGELDAARQCC